MESMCSLIFFFIRRFFSLWIFLHSTAAHFLAVSQWGLSSPTVFFHAGCLVHRGQGKCKLLCWKFESRKKPIWQIHLLLYLTLPLKTCSKYFFFSFIGAFCVPLMSSFRGTKHFVINDIKNHNSEITRTPQIQKQKQSAWINSHRGIPAPCSWRPLGKRRSRKV